MHLINWPTISHRLLFSIDRFYLYLSKLFKCPHDSHRAHFNSNKKLSSLEVMYRFLIPDIIFAIYIKPFLCALYLIILNKYHNRNIYIYLA